MILTHSFRRALMIVGGVTTAAIVVFAVDLAAVSAKIGASATVISPVGIADDTLIAPRSSSVQITVTASEKTESLLFTDLPNATPSALVAAIPVPTVFRELGLTSSKGTYFPHLKEPAVLTIIYTEN